LRLLCAFAALREKYLSASTLAQGF